MESTTKPVHVISLTAQNVKRLKAVRIEPDPANPLVLVGGLNDAGKSSVLDSIVAVLGGKEASPAVPVRKGMKKGSVVLDLGELKATLRFTAAGGRELIVEDAEGKKLPSPQAVMDKLTGKVGFDAEEFIRKDPRDQLAILRRIVGIDFAPLDAKRKAAYEQRTFANQDVTRLEGQLSSAPNPTDAPAELVDTTAVLEELKRAQEHNAQAVALDQEHRDAAYRHEAAVNQVRCIESGLAVKEREIERIERQLSEAKIERDNIAAGLEKYKAAGKDRFYDLESATAKRRDFVGMDVAPLNVKLSGADVANTKVRQAAARLKIKQDLGAATVKVQALNNQIDEIDARKQTMLEEAKFPVKGLSFTEDGILFDGIPFAQASSSTKRRVSVAIGAALNPTLRVMIVKDGSLLDAKSMEQLRELATEHNLQVWVEVVTSGPDARCAVIIEDGQVQGAPQVEDIPETPEKSSTAIVDPPAPADLFGSLPSQ